MNDNHEVKGRPLAPCEIAALYMIPIDGADGYFWEPEGDRVISLKNAGHPYQMKRNKGYPGNWSSIPNKPYYSLATVFGRKLVELSELRKLKPEEKKEEKMNEQKYIVGSIVKSTDAWNVSAFPMPHHDLQSAKTEAARLARAEPSKKFVVLKVEGVVTVADVVWE